MSHAQPARRMFDRTKDISKLEGCDTRNISYRWDIFRNHIGEVPEGSEVLDFGAGSLRETWEFAGLGYRLTAVDLNRATLESYAAAYPWNELTHPPRFVVGSDVAACLEELRGSRFDLILAFDVFEHLAEPAELLAAMHDLLRDGGLLFCTVPNGRTLFELSSALDLMIARATNRKLVPGEPHLQRKSPAEWRAFLERSGFTIVEHDMQIGFFANTWYALVQIPVLLLNRVTRPILRKLRLDFDPTTVIRFLCAKPIMTSLNALDRLTRRQLAGLYGWNLFVAQKHKP